MKRKQITKSPHTLKSIWPWFFWRKCSCCGQEFRREPGWELKVRWVFPAPLLSVGTNVRHLCGDCFPEYGGAWDALQAMINEVWKGGHKVSDTMPLKKEPKK